MLPPSRARDGLGGEQPSLIIRFRNTNPYLSPRIKNRIVRCPTRGVANAVKRSFVAGIRQLLNNRLEHLRLMDWLELFVGLQAVHIVEAELHRSAQ